MNKITAGLYFIAHQSRKRLIRLHRVLQRHSENSAFLRVHRSFPKLFGIHFSQTFVALDQKPLLALRLDKFQHIAQTLQINSLALFFFVHSLVKHALLKKFFGFGILLSRFCFLDAIRLGFKIIDVEAQLLDLQDGLSHFIRFKKFD